MIQIKRTSCPETLKGKPLKGTKYNKKVVVKRLWKMQKKKCCYCETKIPEEGCLKAVDHFRPKSIFKGRKNDWKNLLLACSQCNGKKSNKYPVILSNSESTPKILYTTKTPQNKKPAIIDPSNPRINPEDHLDFGVNAANDHYGRIFGKEKDALGDTTVEVIGLDDTHYIKERRYYYRHTLSVALNSLLEAKDQDEENEVELLKSQFRMILSSKGRFAAFARAFAKYNNLDERFQISIP